MLNKHSIRLGKLLKKTMRLRGGGSALPGLVVEKISPNFLSQALSSLPYGVVVVSGTNGKTTTTKIVTELLRKQGLKVFTNPSGSNFIRGVVAALLENVDDSGKLDADIAVLELDEAHATHFVRKVAPKYSLILNVFRDQLDRFGEIDKTAFLLKTVVESTTHGIVLNRDDELTRDMESVITRDKTLQFFGVDDKLKHLFPSDYSSRDHSSNKLKAITAHKHDVTLKKLDGQTATLAFGKTATKPVELKLSGIHNAQNVVAALTLVRMIMGDKFDKKKALRDLADIRPAFGRGEAVEVDGQPLEIILVKNPSGFRLSLKSYENSPASIMIAVNDQFADGRDMSWLWDVDFSQFQDTKVDFVSGVRAYDMALRLQYDEVEVGRIIPDVKDCLAAFLSETKGSRRIFCTYTAMLALRRELAKNYSLEPIE